MSPHEFAASTPFGVVTSKLVCLQDHIEGVTYGATGTEYKLSNVQVVSHSVIEGTTAAGIGSVRLLLHALVAAAVG